jgi:hypothetical protein
MHCKDKKILDEANKGQLSTDSKKRIIKIRKEKSKIKKRWEIVENGLNYYKIKNIEKDKFGDGIKQNTLLGIGILIMNMEKLCRRMKNIRYFKNTFICVAKMKSKSVNENSLQFVRRKNHM